MLSVARKGGVEVWMPDQVRHDESGTAWLQPSVKRSSHYPPTAVKPQMAACSCKHFAEKSCKFGYFLPNFLTFFPNFDMCAHKMKRFLARKPWKMEWVDGRKPTREELRDRATFR